MVTQSKIADLGCSFLDVKEFSALYTTVTAGICLEWVEYMCICIYMFREQKCFHPYFQLSVLTHTLTTSKVLFSWQVILKSGSNYVFPVDFQLCEMSRALLTNLASATGDFGSQLCEIPVCPPGRCPLF